MNNKIFITFDKSQEDIPVLTTFIENQFSFFASGPSVTITNVITGDDCCLVPDDPCPGPEHNLGENDHSLMQRLANAGTDHRKFMRMMPVYVRITAPLYW